jgi:restriction endonuclease Mrr
VSIPDYETIRLPLLKFASDGIEHSSKEAVELLSRYFKLTNEEKEQRCYSKEYKSTKDSSFLSNMVMKT